MPARHEESSDAEQRLLAWRAEAEARFQARKIEEAKSQAASAERRRKATVGGILLVVLGLGAVTGSLVAPERADETVPAPEVEEAVLAAPAVAIVIPPASVMDEQLERLAEATTAEPIPAPEEAVVAPPPVRRFDPQVVEGTLRTYAFDATEWLQFDFRGAGPLEIRWLDAEGHQALNPWSCDGYIDRTTRRCYVGRTHQRIEVALDAGAAPGTWTIQACEPASGDCARLTTLEVGS